MIIILIPPIITEIQQDLRSTTKLRDVIYKCYFIQLMYFFVYLVYLSLECYP